MSAKRRNHQWTFAERFVKRYEKLINDLTRALANVSDPDVDTERLQAVILELEALTRELANAGGTNGQA